MSGRAVAKGWRIAHFLGLMKGGTGGFCAPARSTICWSMLAAHQSTVSAEPIPTPTRASATCSPPIFASRAAARSKPFATPFRFSLGRQTEEAARSRLASGWAKALATAVCSRVGECGALPPSPNPAGDTGAASMASLNMDGSSASSFVANFAHLLRRRPRTEGLPQPPRYFRCAAELSAVAAATRSLSSLTQERNARRRGPSARLPVGRRDPAQYREQARDTVLLSKSWCPRRRSTR